MVVKNFGSGLGLVLRGMNKKFLDKISQDKREDDESTPDVDESGKSEAD